MVTVGIRVSVDSRMGSSALGGLEHRLLPLVSCQNLQRATVRAVQSYCESKWWGRVQSEN